MNKAAVILAALLCNTAAANNLDAEKKLFKDPKRNWLLIISHDPNRDGIAIAEFESMDDCNTSSLILQVMAEQAADTRGDSEGADIYGKCQKKGDTSRKPAAILKTYKE